MFPDKDFIFQQDGAPSHTSGQTQTFLEEKFINFIKKTEWPPQSPDWNPMDYSIWNSLKEKVYGNRSDRFTLPELKAKIQDSWSQITLSEIRKSILQFKMRLRAVRDPKGGHIDHLLK